MQSGHRAGIYAVLVLVSFAIGCLVGALVRQPSGKRSPLTQIDHIRALRALIARSNAGGPWTPLGGEPNTTLAVEDIPLAREYVYAFADASAFHILLEIRRRDLGVYASIPNVIKAQILVEALSLTHDVDDWVELTDDIFPGEAGTSLLAVGKSALPLLAEVLDDDSRIGSRDGETQAEYDLTQARRKDLAYKLICYLLDRQATYDPDPKKRDAAIAKLKAELKPKG
jgi:hypothetical protein